MKVKLLNVFTVCVVTLAVLSPEILVFGVVWGRHLELVKTQNLPCETNQSHLTLQANSTHTTTSQTSTEFSDPTLVKPIKIDAEQDELVHMMQWLFLLTPICVGLGIICYDRYLVYRATVLQEQIAMLERLWRHSIEQ